MLFTSFFIGMQIIQQLHLFIDAFTRTKSVTAYFLASFTRQELLSLVFVILNLFYLIAAAEAYQDPKVLLDQEY